MNKGPAMGRRSRATWVGALAGLWLALPLPASGQSLTSDLLSPIPGGFGTPQTFPLRRNSDAPVNDRLLDTSPIAPSRIGQASIFNNNAASGAGYANTGFDSVNRRRRMVKYYPGQKKPKPSPGPGSLPPKDPVPPLTIPFDQRNNRKLISLSVSGIAPGQPSRRRLAYDDDPFGPTGVYVGSFLVKSAVEIYGGYNDNPARLIEPKGSTFYRIAPEVLAASNWSRHALLVDLRGSLDGYEKTFPSAPLQISPSPVNVDRIDFTGRIDGRIDVSRDTRINSEVRLRVGADNPGSPNIQAGLTKFPLFTGIGGTVGIEQDFNRLQVRLDALVDRIKYQDSELTNGISTSNADRDYVRYGGLGRVGFEVLPGLRPFVELQGDTRMHDQTPDRFGYLRDSNGGYIKAGTTFEFSRLVTGEASIGYTARSYSDPRLDNLTGLLTAASLVWTATPLTTVRVFSTTSIDETTVPGVSGVLTRTYTAQVDHDFRRWLTGIGRFTYGTQDYQDNPRNDKLYSLQGDLVFKMSREVQLKAQIRRDVLDSNIPFASTAATVVMLGVRLQR